MTFNPPIVLLIPLPLQNQVQNLAIRGQQGAAVAGPQALSLKQTPVPIQPASLIRNPCPQSSVTGVGVGVGVVGAGKGMGPGHADGPSEAGKKAEPEVRAINMSRNSVSGVAGAPPLISPGTLRRCGHAPTLEQHTCSTCVWLSYTDVQL